MATSKPEGTKGLLPRSVIAKRPEYAQAIGMVSIEVANLEIFLGELLGALLHIDRHFGRIIYLTPQANLARVQILENVLKETLIEGTDGRKRIEAIIGRARGLIGKRHELIHNAWGMPAENPGIVTRRALPFLDGKPAKTVPLSELTDLIEALRKLADDVMSEADRAFEAWPPYTWPQKSPERPTGAPDPSERPQASAPPKRKSRPPPSPT